MMALFLRRMRFFDSMRAQNKVIRDIEQRYHLLCDALEAFNNGYEAGVLKSYEALKVWVTLP